MLTYQSNFIQEQSSHQSQKENQENFTNTNSLQQDEQIIPIQQQSISLKNITEKEDYEQTFIEFLKSDQSHSLIQNLIEQYQQKNKLSKVKLKRQMTSIKEEVLEIVQSLEYRTNVLQNIEEIYQFEDYQQQLLRYEVERLEVPFNIMQITERCEDLERILKAIGYQLSFNVMRNSEEFVKGMTKIREIQEDLGGIGYHTKNSKDSLTTLRQKIVMNSAKAMLLKRKQQRLIAVKKICLVFIQKYTQQQEVCKYNISKCNFAESLKLCRTCINELDYAQTQFEIKALEVIKQKFQELILQTREKMILCFSQLCLKFDSQLYERVIQGHNFNIFDVKSNNNNNSTDWLINHLKDKFRMQTTTQMKRALLKFTQNKNQLELIGINQNNPQIKLSSLCSFLDQTYYIMAICDLYKVLSNLMYNHHLMTRHHQLRQSEIETQGEQSKDELIMNQRLRDCLVQDRKDFWNFVQEKIINFITNTDKFVLEMNCREIFDFNVLTNKFIEIGIEYSGEEQSTLLQYLMEDLTVRYTQNFKSQQISNLKNILEKETWDRLPLPDDFVIKEIQDPLQEYPTHFNQMLSLFTKESDQEVSVRKIKNQFSQFALVNPFDKITLISTSNKKIIPEETTSADDNFIQITPQNSMNYSNNQSDCSSDEMDLGDEEEVKVGNINDIFQDQGGNEGASKQLTQFKKVNTINMNKDQIIVSSSLNFIKNSISKYLELMVSCRHLTFDLFHNLTQLCDFYSFIVFHLFADSQPYKRLFDDTILDFQTQKNVNNWKKISELHEIYLYQNRYKDLRNSILRTKNFVEANFQDYSHLQDQNEQQQLSQQVQLIKKIIPNCQLDFDTISNQTKEKVYKSIIAVESLLFINDSITSIKPLIKDILDTQQQSYLIQSYKQFQSSITQMRQFISINNLSSLVSFDQIIINVQFLNWNMKSKKNEISSFVDKIVALQGQLKNSILQLSKKQGKLPSFITDYYIEILAQYICDDLIEVISKMQKVNQIGKQSLQQDLQFLRSKFENQSNKKNICFDILENYNNAYFYQEDELLRFLKENVLEYTYNQIYRLIDIAPNIVSLKGQEKKEFMMNVEIFYSDYFNNFMLANSSHQY